jgi:non-ribosomal peptide synthetase component F
MATGGAILDPINLSYDELLACARALRRVLEPLLTMVYAPASLSGVAISGASSLSLASTPLVLLRATRTPSLVVGLLGVLASGAAYIPIDPEHPRQRQRLIAMHSHAYIAVVSAPEDPAAEVESAGSAAAPRSQAEDADDSQDDGDGLGPFVRWVVLLDSRGHVAAVNSRPLRPAVPVPSPAVPRGLAYMMFTSGSTGLPKGVLVSILL